MFEVNNGIVKIDGSQGKYGSENSGANSAQYGRNSVQNLYSYYEEPIVKDNNATPPILDFGMDPNKDDNNIQKMEEYVKANDDYLNSLPPLEYEYRYMPNVHKAGEIDKDALFGAAYEELGSRKEVSVEELDKTVALNENYSSKPLDLNNDNKIDLGEYGSSILAADLISNNGEIKGTINKQGQSAIFELMKKSNAQAATQLYGSIYNQFNLGEASKNFNP